MDACSAGTTGYICMGWMDSAVPESVLGPQDCQPAGSGLEFGHQVKNGGNNKVEVGGAERIRVGD